jgi:hypothetical protein
VIGLYALAYLNSLTPYVLIGHHLCARHCSGLGNTAIWNKDPFWNLHSKGMPWLFWFNYIVIFIPFHSSSPLDFKLFGGRDNCPDAWPIVGSLKFFGD